ncbi:hypothetical protein D3C80_921000 [compost metagenome]
MVGIPINLLKGVLTWCNRRDANPTLIDPATWPSYAIADEIEGRLRVQATDVNITDRIGGPAPAERSDLHQRIRRFIVQMDLHSSGRGGAQPEVIPSLDHIRNIAQVFADRHRIGDAVAGQGGRVGASDHTPKGIDGDTAKRAHTAPTAAGDHFKLQTGGAEGDRRVGDQLPEAVAVGRALLDVDKQPRCHFQAVVGIGGPRPAFGADDIDTVVLGLCLGGHQHAITGGHGHVIDGLHIAQGDGNRGRHPR